MAPATMLLAANQPRGAPAPRRSSSAVRAGRGRPLVTRRRLQVALGLLWLLDGVLQLQPFMFTRGFADRVIAPSASGQPELVAAAVRWSASLVAGHPVVSDLSFAGVQLAIGLALLSRRAARLAIMASIAWSLGVWILGEGAGGLAGGTATFLNGAPGAVLLYALIGLAAWPRLGAEGRAELASRSSALRTRVGVLLAPAGDEVPVERPAAWVPGAWAGVWVLFALLRALPANDSAGAFASQLRANVSSAPAWLARVQHALGTAIGHGGPRVVVAVVVAELAVGLLALWRGVPRRAAAGIGIGAALAVWVVGQAFGQIPTGMGTDPSSGPLVALLGVALLGCAGPRSATAVLSASHGQGPCRARPEAA